jgi:hypothetical protein
MNRIAPRGRTSPEFSLGFADASIHGQLRLERNAASCFGSRPRRCIVSAPAAGRP